MTEEDVKHLYITPALEKDGKWIAEHIGMEHQITDGQINLCGNMVARQRPKKSRLSIISGWDDPNCCSGSKR